MEKDTLTKLTYAELLELYKAVRDEIRRRAEGVPIRINEKPYGIDKP